MRTVSPRSCHASLGRLPGARRGDSGAVLGRVLGKLFLVLIAFLALFETVPRFLEIPGLKRETLDPVYLTSLEHQKFEPHPYLILTPKPGRYGNPRKKEVSHNSAGFRGAEVPLAKPEGGLRIACIGGSSTYGTGPTKDEFAWPARLQAILSDELSPRAVDVINAGVPSFNSFESLGNLAFRVLPYRPDIVLIYLSTNDAECALWPDPTFDNRHYRLSWSTYRPSPIEPILEKSMLYLAWRKYATDYLSQRADLGYVTKVVPPGETGLALARRELPPELRSPPETGFINFQRNLVSLLAVAEAHGARPVLMTQGIFSPDPEGEHLDSGKTRRAAQGRMTEIVRTVAKERGVPLVELKPVLEAAAAAQVAETGQQTLFADSVHLSNDGTALLATTLAAELHRLGLL
ncbi:hypothetical protein Poly30_16440 [Planctomycetes bacterium Poly30]|uniref:SGNH hydrolase-type esterase domain-containing protein n=1 Tax=Saltatorellus ferox TaxID=2528018 RepID=A0A518EPX3_9BACT|nr:hypothetical protein Poly30_16440 [Planctomycetes bacterium Poly30]